MFQTKAQYNHLSGSGSGFVFLAAGGVFNKLMASRVQMYPVGGKRKLYRKSFCSTFLPIHDS